MQLHRLPSINAVAALKSLKRCSEQLLGALLSSSVHAVLLVRYQRDDIVLLKILLLAMTLQQYKRHQIRHKRHNCQTECLAFQVIVKPNDTARFAAWLPLMCGTTPDRVYLC